MRKNKTHFFTEHYNKYSKKLFQVAYRLTGDNGLAEDLANETFCVFLQKIDYVYNHNDPKGWLFKTLYNLLKNELRKKKYTDMPLDEHLPYLHDLGAKINEESMYDLLPDSLSKSDHDIVVMKYHFGLTNNEIANKLGISQTACGVRLFRARERYAELYKIGM